MYNDKMRDPFYDPLIQHNNAQINTPQEPLEVKDQHIVALASQNGFLIGRNSVLENQAYERDQRIKTLEKELKTAMEASNSFHKLYDDERDERYELRREVDRLKQYEKYAPKLKKGAKS